MANNFTIIFAKISPRFNSNFTCSMGFRCFLVNHTRRRPAGASLIYGLAFKGLHMAETEEEFQEGGLFEGRFREVKEVAFAAAVR